MLDFWVFNSFLQIVLFLKFQEQDNITDLKIFTIFKFDIKISLKI